MLMSGKTLEKLVNRQLVEYLSINSRLHPAEHGFIAGKFTLTNLQQRDKYVN
jgi:hypothetical protein